MAHLRERDSTRGGERAGATAPSGRQPPASGDIQPTRHTDRLIRRRRTAKAFKQRRVRVPTLYSHVSGRSHLCHSYSPYPHTQLSMYLGLDSHDLTHICAIVPSAPKQSIIHSLSHPLLPSVDKSTTPWQLRSLLGRTWGKQTKDASKHVIRQTVDAVVQGRQPKAKSHRSCSHLSSCTT